MIKTKVINIRVSSALFNDLQVIANVNNKSKTEVLTTMISKEIKKNKYGEYDRVVFND